MAAVEQKSAHRSKNEQFRELQSQLRQMRAGGTNASVMQCLASMCREEECIRDRKTFQDKSQKVEKDSGPNEAFWRKRFLRRSSTDGHGASLYPSNTANGQAVDIEGNSEANLFTKYVKRKYKKSEEQAVKSITFSENIQDLLLTMTAKFGTDINIAYKSDPTAVMAAGENTVKEAVMKMQMIDDNMKAIDEDMQVLAQAREEGHLTATDYFQGFVQLGSEDYVVSMDDASLSEEEDSEFDSSVGEESEEESDESESEDDFDSDDESSIDSEFMAEMAQELGFDEPVEDDDVSVDVSLVRAIASGRKPALPRDEQLSETKPVRGSISAGLDVRFERSLSSSISDETLQQMSEEAESTCSSESDIEVDDCCHLLDMTSGTICSTQCESLSSKKRMQATIVQKVRLVESNSGTSPSDQSSSNSVDINLESEAPTVTSGPVQHNACDPVSSTSSFEMAQQDPRTQSNGTSGVQCSPTVVSSTISKTDTTVPEDGMSNGIAGVESSQTLLSSIARNTGSLVSDDMMMQINGMIDDSDQDSESEDSTSMYSESDSDDSSSSSLDEEYLAQFAATFEQRGQSLHATEVHHEPPNIRHTESLGELIQSTLLASENSPVAEQGKTENSNANSDARASKSALLKTLPKPSGIGTNMGCFDESGKPNSKAFRRNTAELKHDIYLLKFGHAIDTESDICLAARLATAADESSFRKCKKSKRRLKKMISSDESSEHSSFRSDDFMQSSVREDGFFVSFSDFKDHTLDSDSEASASASSVKRRVRRLSMKSEFAFRNDFQKIEEAHEQTGEMNDIICQAKQQIPRKDLVFLPKALGKKIISRVSATLARRDMPFLTGRSKSKLVDAGNESFVHCSESEVDCPTGSELLVGWGESDQESDDLDHTPIVSTWRPTCASRRNSKCSRDPFKIMTAGVPKADESSNESISPQEQDITLFDCTSKNLISGESNGDDVENVKNQEPLEGPNNKQESGNPVSLDLVSEPRTTKQPSSLSDNGLTNQTDEVLVPVGVRNEAIDESNCSPQEIKEVVAFGKGLSRRLSFSDAFKTVSKNSCHIPQGDNLDSDNAGTLPGTSTTDRLESDVEIVFPKIDFKRPVNRKGRSGSSISTKQRRKIRQMNMKTRLEEETGYIEGLMLVGKESGKAVRAIVKRQL